MGTVEVMPDSVIFDMADAMGMTIIKQDGKLRGQLDKTLRLVDGPQIKLRCYLKGSTYSEDTGLCVFAGMGNLSMVLAVTRATPTKHKTKRLFLLNMADENYPIDALKSIGTGKLSDIIKAIQDAAVAAYECSGGINSIWKPVV